MKVNSNRDTVDLSQASRAKGANKTNAAKNKGKAEESGGASSGIIGDGASVEISSDAKAALSAKKIASSENTDEANIARVKQMINKGTYKPDFGKVADKMVNEELLQELS